MPTIDLSKTPIIVSQGQQSSVEITTDSKGIPKLTIKVYKEDAQEALEEAVRLYKLGLRYLGLDYEPQQKE